MSEGIDAVRRICEGWNEMTLEEWRSICTPDVAYQNIVAVTDTLQTEGFAKVSVAAQSADEE